MKFQRTPVGLEAQLKVTGFARFPAAAFLTFWLTGWAAGEAFALWALIQGVWSHFTGQPPEPGKTFLPLPAGLFLLFWLTFWTFGGIMAIRELLRLLSGRDRILAGNANLEIERSYGPFRKRIKIPREQIRRFYRKRGNALLCVETTRGVKDVTNLGTPAERGELEEALNAEFRLPTESQPAPALPSGWCEVESPERDAVLVADPVARRRQAKVTWAIFALISSVAIWLLLAAQRNSTFWLVGIIAIVVAAFTAWGAVWLTYGRKEWRLGKGRLILQSRFGLDREVKFEAASIELYENNYGDSGPSYDVIAVAAGAPPRANSHTLGKHRRDIYSEPDDPTGPRRFALWLSHRCEIPFHDLATDAAKARELEQMKSQIAAGPFGSSMLKLFNKLKRD